MIKIMALEEFEVLFIQSADELLLLCVFER
jgi:hypothetical protein